jgi:glucose/mannose-6-phosphate isomerase
MHQLDDIKKIKKMDSGRVLDSIELLGKQIGQVLVDFKKVKLPQRYQQVDKIIINGMGGSALGSYILRSVYFDRLKVPVGVINSYLLPAALDRRTLYLLSSYSGTTEEPLATILEANKKQAKIFGITTGGDLAEKIKRREIAGFVFKPDFNPSGQPRMGLGYSLGAQLALLSKLGVLRLRAPEIKKARAAIEKYNKQFGVKSRLSRNFAKQLALALYRKTPVIIASEFLSGNAHALANQINENAKNYSNYFLISEMNHHLLEGLTFPKNNYDHLAFVFFESKLYHPKNQVRYHVTKDVVDKNKIKFYSYSLESRDKLAQAMEMLVFGSYLSFYLAILNQVNPSKIPWVDYFKAQLKRIV